MEKDISKITDAELDSFGYKLYESKEQLIAQLEQANRNILLIRTEKQKREKTTKKEKK